METQICLFAGTAVQRSGEEDTIFTIFIVNKTHIQTYQRKKARTYTHPHKIHSLPAPIHPPANTKHTHRHMYTSTCVRTYVHYTHRQSTPPPCVCAHICTLHTQAITPTPLYSPAKTYRSKAVMARIQHNRVLVDILKSQLTPQGTIHK